MSPIRQQIPLSNVGSGGPIPTYVRPGDGPRPGAALEGPTSRRSFTKSALRTTALYRITDDANPSTLTMIANA